MSHLTFAGVFSIGFVFGFLLYYAIRHTKEFNIELLSTAVGAVAGGVVIDFFGKIEGWVGPYGIGMGLGFFFYFFLSLGLLKDGKLESGSKRDLLSKSLIGFPRQE